MKRTLTSEAIKAAEAELSASPNERLQSDGLRAKIRSRLSSILPGWFSPSSSSEVVPSRSGETAAHLLTTGHKELENARSSARLYFESRGLKIPSFLESRKASASLEVELANVLADTEAVKTFIADLKAETSRARAETDRLRREFDSTPEGKEILHLRSEIARMNAEQRQQISDILQLDAETTRQNFLAGLLLNYCEFAGIGRPPDLPPDPEVSRFSSDLNFLIESCAGAGFGLPSDLTTIEQVSQFVRSEVPPTVPERQPPAAAAEEQAASRTPAKRRKIVSRKKIRPKQPSSSIGASRPITAESSEADEQASGLGF